MGPTDVHHNIGVCSGYDVAGDGKACSHLPGSCFVDEELHMGSCFQKCSILTHGEYPNRLAAASCCKVTGWACAKPWNVATDIAYNTGGSGHDSPHKPMQSLTEMADT